MNRFALGLAVIIAAGSFAVASQAMADDSFDIADANHDNYVSFDEAFGIYPTLSRQLFNQADDNKDGRLDDGEWGELVGLSAGLMSPTQSLVD